MKVLHNIKETVMTILVLIYVAIVGCFVMIAAIAGFILGGVLDVLDKIDTPREYKRK